MPNIKSAERRMRSSARKHLRNQSGRSRVKTYEKRFATLAKSGNKQQAAEALQRAMSAFDKAAKTGVVHWRAANRKKSRLALRLKKMA